MEQRKWLSWNDVERVLQHVLKTYSRRSRRTTYLPSELYKLKAPNWLEPNHRLNQPSTQKTPVGTKSYRGVPTWVQTP